MYKQCTSFCILQYLQCNLSSWLPLEVVARLQLRPSAAVEDAPLVPACFLLASDLGRLAAVARDVGGQLRGHVRVASCQLPEAARFGLALGAAEEVLPTVRARGVLDSVPLGAPAAEAVGGVVFGRLAAPVGRAVGLLLLLHVWLVIRERIARNWLKLWWGRVVACFQGRHWLGVVVLLAVRVVIL